MFSSEQFLNPETKQTNLCLLCCNNIGKKERSQCLSHDGWPRFKELAFTWSNIVIPFDDYFTELYSKVNDADEAYGRVHKNCRITFRTKSNDYVKKYRSECVVANPAECDESINVPKIPRGALNDKKLCYICYSKREIDSNVYNEGRLGRCSTNNARGRLLLKTDIYERDSTLR